jgi:uncharacterized protein (DUF2235 family)
MKRLAIFLDGTWNDPADDTNVSRLHDLVAPQDRTGISQVCHYDPGVGTEPFTRLLGGAFGEGLSRNVRDAYRFLVNNYDAGDEVYVFGFSRGAYTARSLGGLIDFCGLLQKEAPLSIEEVYDRYRKRLDHEASIDHDAELQRVSRKIPIRLMGVWDTVGDLGIPWTVPLIGQQAFCFHNPNLSSIYEHAFQALAVDENRAAYTPTLWTAPAPGATARLERVEQRWFIGAHADVGGGYKDDPLSFIPLGWMQGKAAALGLAFKASVTVPVDAWKTRPADSYTKFLGGLYRVFKLGRRFWRPIGCDRRKVQGAWSYPVNETIDASVFRRFQSGDYRPQNLLDWAERTGVDLARMSGTPSDESISGSGVAA